MAHADILISLAPRRKSIMSRLIYSTIASLDGYIADENGNFDWGFPDEEVHTFINDLERPVGTYLLGRKMYEVMVAWESPEMQDHALPYIQDFARIWQAANKIVYSRTLETVSSTHTSIQSEFDPAAIRQLKDQEQRDISIGGPGLGEQAFQAGLIDEYYLILVPVIVGGGRSALPRQLHLKLELLDEHRFKNGMVYLRYRLAA
jgi:dihydrofolate reductase